MKKSENQKFYFEFSYLENPILVYLDIIYRINEQYDVENIAFREKQFYSMKYRIKKQNDDIRLKEERLKTYRAIWWKNMEM